VGDRVEAATIAAAVGRHPVVTATKSMTGHLMGAAGALGAVVTVLSLRDGLVPAIRNLARREPEIDLDLVHGTGPRRTAVAAALVNAFGFGGHNASLAFTRA
jgi:3-oxoacyl-[acyl-carrier-protein] synthase II